MIISGIKETKYKLLYGIVLMLFFVICTELFRRMTISNPPLYNAEGISKYNVLFYNYYSDIRYRLNMPRGAMYSMFLIPEFAAYDALGEAIGSWFIAIYLSLFTVGTVPLVYWLLKKLCPNAKTIRLITTSLTTMFVIPIFVFPLISYGMKMYGAYFGSIWHNETYLGMRFFAVLILLSFYDSNDSYLKSFKLKEFIVQCLLFTAVNLVKPSFIIAFAPSMLIMMIVDIIRAKGRGFVLWIMYGLPVLIGSVVLIYQYFVLFPSSGGDDSSHVIIALNESFKNQELPIFELFRSYAFPLYMSIIHIKEIVKSKFHLVCYLGWFFSFLEYLFLSESGPRSSHGNFGWGICLFTFIIFCLNIGFYLRDVSQYDRRSKNRDNRVLFYKLVLGKLLLVLHLLSGILYFIIILQGFCAYMI